MWRSSGYLMAIYVAAIVSVDEDLYEAARVDGANWLQSTRRITLPLIMPAVTVGAFLMLSISSKLFDVIFALTNGGPYGTTEAFALNIYNEAFIYNNLGLASAKAVIFFVAVGVLTLVQVRFTRSREVER
jgi:raffinose/stachyose/melibiose transport system permease protein